MKAQKMTTIDLIVAKATEIANLRARGKERARRAGPPYDQFAKRAQLAKLAMGKALSSTSPSLIGRP